MFLTLALALLQEPVPVLRGLDPVELAAGREVPGLAEHAHDRNGLRYAFASEENAETFEADPTRYEIQMGGACARMGPLSGRGNPDLFLVHEGRIYVFASYPCRDAFKKTPERFVEPVEGPVAGDEARGRELVALALQGLGGAPAVDGLTSLELAHAGARDDTPDWRQDVRWEFGAAPALVRTEAWGDWVYREEERGGVLHGGVVGKVSQPQHWAARHEFELQLGRELVYLLRQRASPVGFEARAVGKSADGARETLVLRWNGRNTAFELEPASGRALRASWLGRLGAEPNARVVVDFADFESVGPLTLPRTRTVSADGTPVPYLSGRLVALAVDTPAR